MSQAKTGLGKLQVPQTGAAASNAPSRSGSKKLTRSGSKLGPKGSKASSKQPSTVDDADRLPGGWASSAERYKFLQKVRRDEGYRENEREERLEALMEARTHALRLQNCWPLWEDEQVRNSLLDAIQAPNPERGKSLYVDEGPPPNHPSVRTAALGILVQLALDEGVREHMAQDTLLRESLVEALRLEPAAAMEAAEATAVAASASSRPGTSGTLGEKDEAEDLTPPIPVQSRAQQLLAMLVPVRACAKALRRPADAGLPVEEDFDYVWMEESEEEEINEDDPIVEVLTEAGKEYQATQMEGTGEPAKAEMQDADGDASSQGDPDALLAEVEDILYAKKASSDQDLLDVLAMTACPPNPKELQQLPPWRPGAAQSRRLDTLWTFAATRNNAENTRLWRCDKVRETLLFSAEVTQPDCVRISSLGALTALMARDENKVSMWEDEGVRKAFVLGASEQISAPLDATGETKAGGQESEVKHLRPQRLEVRLQAMLGLSMLAESDELREEIWKDKRLVASVQNAVETPGPLRPIGLQVLQHLSQSAEIQADMVKCGIRELLATRLPDLEKHQHRACEIAHNRLLAV